MNEFPKLMWAPDGVEVKVLSAAEQAEKEAAGFCLTPPGAPKVPVTDVEKAKADESDSGDDHEPTFGPPGDDTHAKRGGKKK